ncbi:MAG: HU family DNA-binding protein [Alphaproteobacteria bacterium]|jgi:DNA-binding protein HU-beta|nr:HU family DNA-binding protein [Alphaproteobacteria bacterium]
MNKTELSNALADRESMTRADAQKAVDSLFAIIAEEMGKGVEVRVTGFGIFSATQTKEREGRNPRTGEKMTIAASTQPKFKAFKALKDSLNG